MRSARNLVQWVVFAGMAAAVAGCSDDNPEFPGILRGDAYVVTNFNRLAGIKLDEPGKLLQPRFIGGLPINEVVVAIDLRPADGLLYGLTSQKHIVRLDLESAVATVVSTLAADPADGSSPFSNLIGANFGIDFNPVSDRLRVVSDSGQNLRVDVDSGLTFTDSSLSVSGNAVGGVSSVAYGSNFAAACRTAAYYIGIDQDTLFSSGSPNGGGLTALGSLGVNADTQAAFEITTDGAGTDTAFAALSVKASQDAEFGNSALYRLNLATGAATKVGDFGGFEEEEVRGLAIPTTTVAPPQSPGDLIGVTTDNRVVSFNASSPGKSCTSAAISGLAAGESAVGVDVRPATGDLVLLTAPGKAYTLNPASGATSNGVTLSVTLSGNQFGVDFNPAVDRLRVVSDTGQNLRVDVSSGATTADTALSVQGVAGVAYTDSIANGSAASLSTTLFGIDSNLRKLVRIGADPAVAGTGVCPESAGNPNCGVVTAVSDGELGVQPGSLNGFDIDGRNNRAILATQVAGAGPTVLYSVNLASGAATALNGSVANSSVGAGTLRGLTLAGTPAAARVFATNDAGQLLSFTPAAPGSVTTIGSLQLPQGESVAGLDFRPATGLLYALSSAGKLYSVNLTTGAATPASTLDQALNGTLFGADFDPVEGALRVVSDTRQNLRILNPAGGVVFIDSLLGNPEAMSVTAAAYTNSFSGAVATDLFAIDTGKDRLVKVVSPSGGSIADVGALGFDAGEVNGFEIVAADTAVAALKVGGQARLYSVDLDGLPVAATLVGTIGDGTLDIRGLAALPSATAPAADSAVLALTGANALVSFARNAPATLATPVSVTGLQAGENLLGIDFRPANGLLYGLGSSGRLYTVNTATGVATLVAPLSVALSGTHFGVDFNPVADRLRIVSDTGQNLRVVVQEIPANGEVAAVPAGTTFVDSTLNRVAPRVLAAAYTNSVAGAASTQLFVLDAANGNSIKLQDPPNQGSLSQIGFSGLALDGTQSIGFDIAGGNNGFALLSAVEAGAARSALFRVNMQSGAASKIGEIGAEGAAPVRNIAIQVK
jgi:hypothetical protein